jgi:hypothetical protein
MNKDEMDALDKHLKQWKQISERLHGQLKPVMEAQKLTVPALGPPLSLEIQKALRSSLEPFLEEQKKLQKVFEGIKLPNLQLPDFSVYRRQIKEYQKSLNKILSPVFEELQRSLRELPPKIQEALLLLAEHGWYLDFNMPPPSLWEIKKAISSGEIIQIEEALVDYFESQLEEIEKSITAQFPHRAHIISSAINAHRRGEYCLSIPVLLAQTDGICKEVVDQYLFKKKNKKPETAIYVEQLAADTYMAALLSPLTTNNPISQSEGERKEGFNMLNRHMVLHGESLDYGSKVNGLKAISLINYVSQALKADADYP